MKTLIRLALAALLMASAAHAADAPAKKKSAPKKPAAAEKTATPSKIEAIAKTLTPAQSSKLLALLNEGTEADLVAIPGVGEVRAAAIKKARPFKAVTDVSKVDGVGEATFAEMTAYAKAGFPKAAEAAKSEPKKETAKKKKSTTTKKKS